jgi:kinesin family protein 3/17
MEQGIICHLTSPEGHNNSSDPPKSFTFDGAYHIDSTTESIYNDVGFPIVEVSAVLEVI